MLRAKSQLFEALAAEGLSVDPSTLAVSVSTGSSSFGSGSGRIMEGEFEWIPSSRLFRRAEYVRTLLEEEIIDMFGEMEGPANEGDVLSSAAFSRAMSVQCSQLAGQLAVLLRCLSKSCKEQLEKKLKNSSPISNSDVSEISPLLAGTLIIGRLSWLLKIRGRFIEEALVQSKARSLSVSTNGSGAELGSVFAINAADLSSEEQLRSAFEIADTDGDGVVTNAEALEAIQALSTGNTLESSTPPQYLHPSVVPSLSFNEFVLVCNDIVNENESRPLIRFRACVDDVAQTAHGIWSSCLLDGLRRRFDLSMRLELLGIDTVFDGTLSFESLFGKAFEMSSTLSSHDKKNLCRKLFSVTKRKLKISWVTETLELEDVMIPTGISASLTEFLFSISKHSSGSLLSVDTIQELPLYDIFDKNSKNGLESFNPNTLRLADQGLASVMKHAMAQIVTHYESLKVDVSEVAAAQKTRYRKERSSKNSHRLQPLSVGLKYMNLSFLSSHIYNLSFSYLR